MKVATKHRPLNRPLNRPLSSLGRWGNGRWGSRRWGRRLSTSGLLSAIAIGCGLFSSLLIDGLPANANEQAADSDAIRLRNGAAEVRGVTSGTHSLAEMAGRDRRRKVCLGYANETPDHMLILTQPQPRLRIAVNSEGKDTTLLVLGPRGIDCNDNRSRNNRDAAITAQDWPEGEYRIWVGSFEEGDQINYQLQITNPNDRQTINDALL